MSIHPGELKYLCDFVYRRSAIVLGTDKEYLLEARLAPLAHAEGLASIEALIAKLRTPPPNVLHSKVIEALTTHETTFFRDHHPFESLKRAVIPALKVARATSKTLCIVSAACSTGQEPYSIAMLLKEHFPELASWSVRIIGLDLSTPIVERARAGRFSQIEINRGLPPSLIPKYFDQVGADWQLKSTVRDLVEFRQMNLIEPWPSLPKIDVLMLRNVLIYFDVPTKKAILERAKAALAPDGYMFLGGAETTLNIDDGFESVQVDKAVCYRRRR